MEGLDAVAKKVEQKSAVEKWREQRDQLIEDAQITANVLLAEWQAALKLLDWDISVKIFRLHELGTEHDGYNQIDGGLKSSRIALLWEEEKPDYEIESTLIHELLHIHLDFWDTDSGGCEDTLKEQAIESIVKALLELKYDDSIEIE